MIVQPPPPHTPTIAPPPPPPSPSNPPTLASQESSPKSAILTPVTVSSSRFSGLRSRWTTMWRWQYHTPEMICWKKRRASSSFSWKWKMPLTSLASWKTQTQHARNTMRAPSCSVFSLPHSASSWGRERRGWQRRQIIVFLTPSQPRRSYQGDRSGGGGGVLCRTLQSSLKTDHTRIRNSCFLLSSFFLLFFLLKIQG